MTRSLLLPSFLQSGAFAAAGLLAAAAPAVAATPAARQVYAPLWVSPAIELQPCLLSIALPPAEGEKCIPWTRREASGPAFHAPSGIVVLGGSDRMLRGVSGIDGKTVYAVTVPGAVVAQPVLDDDGAFFGTQDAHVLRTDVTSGRVRWDQVVDAEVTEPVAIHGGRVVVATGLGSVYAFDQATGEPMWVHKHPLPRGITLRGYARPLVVDVATDGARAPLVYVGNATGRLTVLDLATGKAIAELPLAPETDTFADADADPILVDGSVVAASYTGGVFALDPVRLTERWHLSEGGFVRLAGGGDRLVVAAGAGKVVGIDVKTGKPRWRFTFERGAPSRIVVKGGRVHVASDRGALYVLDLFSGRPLQYYGTGTGFAADLDLDGDMLFALSTGGNLHALSNAFRGTLQQKR